MNITVYPGANTGNDPALMVAVRKLERWIGQTAPLKNAHHRRAAEFQPSSTCKNLDCPPGSLRLLQVKKVATASSLEDRKRALQNQERMRDTP